MNGQILKISIKKKKIQNNKNQKFTTEEEDTRIKTIKEKG